MSRRPTLTEGIGFAGLSFAFSITVGIATGILVARLYGIQVVGEFALAAAPVGAMWFLSTVREQPAFVRLIAPLDPRAPRVTGLFVAVFAFSSALTLAAALLVTGGTYLLYEGPVGQPQLFTPAVAGVAGYVLLTNPCWNFDSVFAGFGDGRRLLWIRAHQSVAFLVLVVALSFVLPTVWGPVLATIGSWSTSLVHRFAAVRAWMRLRVPVDQVRADFRELPEIIKFGLKLTPGSLATGAGGQVTIWTLGAVTTVADVGAYNRATIINRRFGEVNTRIREMLFPALVRRRAAEDKEAFTRAVVDSLRYQMVALLLPASVLGGASVAVMGLFGPEFEFAAPVLAISMLLPAITGGNGIRAAAVIALDRPLNATFAQVAGMVVKVGAVIPLTLAWGIIGAAIAALLGSISVNLWLGVVVRKHVGMRPTELMPPRQLATVGVAYAAGFGVAALLQDVLVQPIGLAVALLAGAGAYVATYLAAGGPTERDWSRFRGLVSRFRRRPQPRVARAA